MSENVEAVDSPLMEYFLRFDEEICQGNLQCFNARILGLKLESSSLGFYVSARSLIVCNIICSLHSYNKA